MRNINVRIPEAHYQALKTLAETEDRDISWIVRRYIRNGLAESDFTLQNSVNERTLGVPANP